MNEYENVEYHFPYNPQADVEIDLYLERKKFILNNDIEFGEDKWPLKEFWERHEDAFPLLVTVHDGFLGTHGFDTFGNGETYFVMKASIYPRVVAKDLNTEGQHLSIPLDHKMDVILVDSEGRDVGKSCKLSDIMQTKTLPLRIRVMGHVRYDFQEDAGVVRTRKFNMLQLVQRYDERYLLCNAISDSSVFWGRCSTMPMYLPIRLSTGTPKRGKGEPWRLMVDQVIEQSKVCQYKYHPVNKEIMVFDEDDIIESDGIYDYISPKQFLAAQEGPPKQVSKESSSKTPPSTKPKPQLKPGERPVRPTRVKHSYDRFQAPLPTDSKKDKAEKPVIKQTSQEEKEEYVTVEVKRQSNVYEYIEESLKRTQEKPQKEHAKTLPKPTPKQNPPAGGAKPAVSASVLPLPDTPKSIRTVKDIPDDISELGVEEIGQCLHLLKLDGLVEGFKQNQINGILLRQLEPGDLQEEFNCNKLTAKRLCLFAKGEWRPDQ